jgi:acetyl esterase/lipase
VKAHADEYGIDPNRVGIIGASAGGHLASLATVTPLSGNPKSKDPLGRLSTDVAAAGIFFPPTDFLNWGDEGKPDFNRIGAIFFPGGIKGHSEQEIEKKAAELSPALRIKGKTPPFIIWHGDADPLVPLQQSEEFVAKLKKAGTDVTFKVKPGGGHPWLTISEEVEDMANWFDTKLGVAAE